MKKDYSELNLIINHLFLADEQEEKNREELRLL
jgi:hypothetical protein